MGDFRCANPEYQLDVDVMMLEYTLYHAIDTKLKVLKAQERNPRTKDEVSTAEALTNGVKEQSSSAGASEMVEVFDLLIQLFRQQHPTYSLSEGTNFNIKVLEFLILLDQCLHEERAVEKLKKERSFNSEYRRRWLRLRITDPSSKNDFNKYVGPGSPDQIVFTTDQIELNDCLPRFMDISAEIGVAMGSVNEQWYKLAAEFMLQSAADRTRFLPDYVKFHRDNPGEAAMHTSECFAWGLIHPHPSDTIREENPELDAWAQERLDDQTYITNIFHTRDSDSEAGANGSTDVEMSNTPAPDPIEDPTWTALRTEALDEFFRAVYAGTMQGDFIPYEDIIDAFRTDYCALPDFLNRLYGFIEGAWCLNAESISGKPTLVQIEEGGLDGLAHEEFRQFLDRVGLKMGGNGVIRWVR